MSVENARENLQNVVDALASAAALIAEAKESERDALDHLMAVRARRNDVASNPSDAHLAIHLLGELEAAEETHITADKKLTSLTKMHDDLVKAHATATANLATATHRSWQPAAEKALATDLAAFEAWVKAHAECIELRRKAAANIHGTGFTDNYYRVLERYDVRQDLGAKR